MHTNARPSHSYSTLFFCRMGYKANIGKGAGNWGSNEHLRLLKEETGKTRQAIPCSIYCVCGKVGIKWKSILTVQAHTNFRQPVTSPGLSHCQIMTWHNEKGPALKSTMFITRRSLGYCKRNKYIKKQINK